MNRVMPYQGLVPYDEDDAPYFFGRDTEREIIIANLMASRLTLLYGASGVGKSSVLGAGVVHHLNHLAQENLAGRGTHEFAVVVFKSWRDNPLAGLTERIRSCVASTLNGQPSAHLPPSLSFIETIEQSIKLLNGELLIILDQFEEYFLYHEQEEGEGTFAVEFPRAVNRPDLRANFLISTREDALAKLDRFKGRIPGLFENYLRVEHLNRESARAAIVKPIEKYNESSASVEQKVRIEPALVDAVLDQVQTGKVVLGEAGRGVVAKDSGKTQIEAPFLQLVMERLWNEEIQNGTRVLRVETLDRLGGAKSIVRTHLDKKLGDLSPEQQEAAASVFNYLVTPSGTKIAHTIIDLAGYTQLPRTQLGPLLEQLSSPGIRILRPIASPPDRPGEPRYEIFHDVLARAILDWRARYTQKQEQSRTAAEAAKREAEAQHELAQVQALAAEQQRYAEAEHRRVMQLRLGLIGMALLMLAMIFLTLFAFQQRAEANRARNEADELRVTAEGQRDSANKAKREAVIQQAIAEEQRDTARRAQATADMEKERADRALSNVIKAEAEAIRQRDAAKKAEAIALEAAEVAREQKKEADSLQLSSGALTHGLTHLEDEFDLSLLLFLSANRLRPDDEGAIISLRHGLKSNPRLSSFLRAHTDRINDVAYSPDRKTLASVSNDGAIIIWNLETLRPLGEPLRREKDKNPITSLAFSSDGKLIASGHANKTITLWNATTRQQLGPPLTGHEGAIATVAFHPHRDVLASGDSDGVILLWDTTNRRKLGSPLRLGPASRLGLPTGRREDQVRVTSLAFSPDGRMLASGSSDRRIILWDWEKAPPLGDPLTKVEEDAPRAEVLKVAFSPNGKMLASGSADGSVVLWDLVTRQPHPLRGHKDSVVSLAFSPESKMLASGSSDETILLWDAVRYQRSDQPRLKGHKGLVTSLAFSPDGSTLASGGADHNVILWDVATRQRAGRQLKNLQIPGNLTAFSPDGKILATSATTTTRATGRAIILWSAETGEMIGKPLLGHTNNVTSLSFSPDGKTLASGSSDTTVRLWDVAKQDQLGPPLSEHKTLVTSLAFSPDGKTLASGGADDTIWLWDVATREERSPLLRGRNASILSLAFSPNGQTLASGGSNGTIVVWDLAEKQPLGRPLVGHNGSVTSLAFTRDGKILASGSSDKNIILWDATTTSQDANTALYQRLAPPLTGHTAMVAGLAFSQDSKLLASSGGGDRTIRMWDVAARQPRHSPFTLPTNLSDSRVTSLAFSPDGKTLVSAGDDSSIFWWDLEMRRLSRSRSLTGLMEPGSLIAFSPDGKILATNGTIMGAEEGHAVILWDARSGAPIGKPLTGHNSPVTSLSFSLDGKLATGSRDGAIRLWDVATHNPFGPPLKSHAAAVTSLVFSLDSATLASGSADGGITLWEVAQHRKIEPPLTGHTAAVSTLAFSSDGKLASGSSDYTVRLWDVTRGQQLSPTLNAHNAPITSVAFSPDGKILASSSYLAYQNESSTIILWDVETRRRLEDRPFKGQNTSVTNLAFSQDGRTLASADINGLSVWQVASGKLRDHLKLDDRISNATFSADGQTLAVGSRETITLWDISVQSEQARACRIVNRNLTLDEWATFWMDPTSYDRTCPDFPINSEQLLESARSLASSGKVEEAEAIFRRVKELDRSQTFDPHTEASRLDIEGKAMKLLKEGQAIARTGRIKEAVAKYEEAQKLSQTLKIPAAYWNTICWRGALWGHPSEYMGACEKAVEGDTNGNFHDSRGLARALSGNIEGAIRDFEEFIRRTSDPNGRRQREGWVNDLRAGKKKEEVFTPEVLNYLRYQ